MPKAIIAVSVRVLWESCDRWTYYVRLESEEGFDKTPVSFRTGSKMNNYEGLSREQARDQALIEAAGWADFLDLTPTPFVDRDGETYEPSMVFRSYSGRRQIAAAKGCRPGDAD